MPTADYPLPDFQRVMDINVVGSISVLQASDDVTDDATQAKRGVPRRPASDGVTDSVTDDVTGDVTDDAALANRGSLCVLLRQWQTRCVRPPAPCQHCTSGYSCSSGRF